MRQRIAYEEELQKINEEQLEAEKYKNERNPQEVLKIKQREEKLQTTGIWLESSALPPHAVKSYSDGYYVIRGSHNGKWIPGSYVSAAGKAFVSFAGKEHQVSDFEVNFKNFVSVSFSLSLISLIIFIN